MKMRDQPFNVRRAVKAVLDLVASLDGDVLVRFFLSSNSTLASLCAVFALLRLSRRVLPSILSSC